MRKRVELSDETRNGRLTVLEKLSALPPKG